MALVCASVLLPLSACEFEVGTTSPAGGSPDTGPSAGGDAPQTGSQDGPAGQTIDFNGLNVQLPASWKAVPDGNGGGRWHITTGGSCGSYGYLEADACRGWWLLGADDIAQGNEGSPYSPGRPYYPQTDSVPCPTDPETYQTTPQSPQAQGLVPVGDHRGDYREWAITCISPAGGARTGGFVQRLVYLPESRILVVDNWQTPGLMNLLKNATWR
ncbi:hypothetical protein [Thermomonospora echinospora]|uniref:hypothetical protein n=1 Tax=Thermomonospora echinospora TaxID=1992 RepID=UPI000CDF1474|nr:hypothetical protein [Thermomonospora echinospora]